MNRLLQEKGGGRNAVLVTGRTISDEIKLSP